MSEMENSEVFGILYFVILLFLVVGIVIWIFYDKI